MSLSGIHSLMLASILPSYIQAEYYTLLMRLVASSPTTNGPYLATQIFLLTVDQATPHPTHS